MHCICKCSSYVSEACLDFISWCVLLFILAVPLVHIHSSHKEDKVEAGRLKVWVLKEERSFLTLCLSGIFQKKGSDQLWLTFMSSSSTNSVPCLGHMAKVKGSSIQFSHSVMSNSSRPNVLQHTRLPCPSPTPRACSNSCPSSWWCHPTISSSVVPFSYCLQSFPASGSFPMSQFFTSGGQSIGVSASVSVLLMNIQD